MINLLLNIDFFFFKVKHTYIYIIFVFDNNINNQQYEQIRIITVRRRRIR